MRQPVYGVVLFPSVSHCMRGESLLQAAGVRCKLIPIPRELSSDCGVALRFEWPDRERIEALFREAGLAYERVSRLPS